ncbi:MAG: hypothetical protein HND43_11240 [Armatimonadetes bacterium]|nr:hypothetical protein [Armatimonadota bacterium]
MTLSWVPPGEEEVSGHYDENLAENLPTSRYYYDGQMMVVPCPLFEDHS